MQLPVLNGSQAAPVSASRDPRHPGSAASSGARAAGSGLGVHDSLDSSDQRRQRIARGLRSAIRGEVRFGLHDRLLYSTDASLYQVEPLGVVIPRDVDDAERAVRWCIANGVAVLPRGGGTSLAGQCTNEAVVIDLSAFCRAVGGVERGGGDGKATVVVEAGAVLDDLNRELLRRAGGLFFAPDPATTAQATVGGCIGNNAAGGRSIRYGRTSENLAGVEVVLATGERLWLERHAGSGTSPTSATARRLAEGVLKVVTRHAGAIRDRFPRTIRRNAGYGLDMILDQASRGATAGTLDLAPLLCGSEGTLAVTLRARLKLSPLPTAKGMAVISFSTLEDAIAAVKPILDNGLPLGLSAVELLDDVVLDAARGNLEYSKYVELLPGASAERREPKAALYVEFFGFGSGGAVAESQLQVATGFQSLRELITRTPGARAIECYTDAAAMLKAWKLRKAGEPLLHGLPGKRKPITFVEDNAVPVERLGEFVREFKKIVGRHGTRAAFWAHASVGVLHVRPMIDLHDPADRDRMREIAVEVADLARACGGIMSGEHGDGRVRGPLLERFFGSDLMRAFAEVKAVFDPKGLLNPGMIVAPAPLASMTENLRSLAATPVIESHLDGTIDGRLGHTPAHTREAGDAPNVSSGTERRVEPSGAAAIETFFDYQDQHGLQGAAEMCNGAGVCRKTSGGAMCPSYRATLDERHSTRGRGNALRLAITGQIARDHAGNPVPAWDDADTIATLHLCLSCKACKSECPSNVDIARLKAEYTAQRYAAKGKSPLQARVFGHVRRLNRLGAMSPAAANWLSRRSITKLLLARALGLEKRRSIPAFAPSLYRQFAARQPRQPAPGAPKPGAAGRVALFADCFTTYNDPHIGLAAVRVLEHLGYAVELWPRTEPSLAAGVRGKQGGCCGRALISTGLLADAIAEADRTLELLRPAIEDPAIAAILVLEPSCLSAFEDDWLQLRLRTPIELRRALAAKAMLVEQFIAPALAKHAALRPTGTLISVDSAPVILHAHCHQKALWGAESSAAALRAVFGERLTVLDNSCCGMAGSFGYTTDRYELSMKIGEQSVFGALRSSPNAIVAAPGTSCRHQMHDGTGRLALHPVEVIAQALGI
ncbi:MAG: FAD-binding protein [Phycisphaerales bacterium]|nr:FAD-binding protein [Phycisphaerales bacterium]